MTAGHLHHRDARALLELLWTGGTPACEAALRRPADAARAGALLALARREKCHRDLLELWARQGDLGAQADELAALRDAADEAARATALLPDDCVLLKGASLLRFYPPGTTRQSCDVDVLVRDFAGLHPLHRRLLEAGFLPVGTGFWWIDVADPRRGSASLRYARPGRADTMPVEVQVGGFPVGWAHLLPAAPLVDGSVALEGMACRGLSPQGTLELMFASFHGRRGPVTIRHLVDLKRLFEHAGADLDVAALARRLREVCAWRAVRRFRADMAALGLTGDVPAPLQALAEQARPRAVALSRWRLVEAVALAAERLRATRAVAGMALRASLVTWMLRQRRRLCGVPLSNVAQAETALIGGGGRLYFACPAGFFVLSLVRVDESLRKRLYDELKRCKLRKLDPLDA